MLAQISPETKKISWKWRLKVVFPRIHQSSLGQKQRKSPENGDWKIFAAYAAPHCGQMKQRKSPENGDWKTKYDTNCGCCVGRNKENLLKMEIESQLVCSEYADSLRRNKENLLKMEIESCLFCRIRQALLRETKKISWKWRLKDVPVPVPDVEYSVETKKISWKWRLKVNYETLCVDWLELFGNKENLLKMEIESLAMYFK